MIIRALQLIAARPEEFRSKMCKAALKHTTKCNCRIAVFPSFQV